MKRSRRKFFEPQPSWFQTKPIHPFVSFHKVLHNFPPTQDKMSTHYGNSLTVVSPNQQHSPYEVPKFESSKGTRKSSYAQAPQSSSYMHIKAVPVSPIPPRNKRSSLPITPLALPLSQTSNRSRSFSSPNILTPKASFLDTSNHSHEESKTPPSPFHGKRHSVIGLPSEYPAAAIHNHDGSVVSSFASSVASSLLMEELEDFEQFFGDDLYGTKVYDDHSCNTHQSPLKCDISKPSHVRVRGASDNTLDSVRDVTQLHSTRPGAKPATKRDSCTSITSANSLSSKHRRRRNFGLNENDFQKITNDFSSLIMQ